MAVKPKNGKITVESRRKRAKSFGMTPEHKQKVLDWIEQNLSRMRMSGAELERQLSVRKGWYADIKRQTRKRVAVNHEMMTKLERVFGESFGQTKALQKVIAPPGKNNDNPMRAGGVLSIGYKDATMKAKGQAARIPPSPVARYEDLEQEAWQALDNSGAPLITEGGYALAVDFKAVRSSPQIGDEVIIKRYHPLLFAQGDLSQAECTVRVVTRDERGIVFKSPGPDSGTQGIVYNPDDKSVVIEKLIIGYASYKP